MRNKILTTITFTIISIFFAGAKNNSTNDSINAFTSYKNAYELIRDGFFLEAIDSLNYSAELRENIYSIHSLEYGNVQNLLGICYKNLGNLNKAIDHFMLAEEALLSDKKYDNINIAKIYNNMGNVYKSKLDYGTAYEYFNRAIVVFSQDKDNNIFNIADVYYNIADIMYLQKRYDEALEVISKYSEVAYPDAKLFYLGLKAAIYQETKQFDQASMSYIEALNYASEIYSDNDINIIYEYINYARFLIDERKFTEAKEIIAQVDEILRHNNQKEGYTHSIYLTTLGYLYENLIVESKELESFKKKKASNLYEAINLYNKSLSSLGIDLNEDDKIVGQPNPTISLTESLTIIKQIASTYTKISDLHDNETSDDSSFEIHKALAYYNLTIELIQKARKEIYSDENKIKLSELEEETFYNTIQTAWKAKNLLPNKDDITDNAFLTAERMKASSLFDRLSDQLAISNSLVPDSLTERERSLNYNITMLNEKLYSLQHENDADEIEINKTDSALFQLTKQREELNQYLEANYKEYYEMKYSSSMTGIDDIQPKLKSNEVLIEYVLDESNEIPDLYAFIISSGQKNFYKLNIDSRFNHYLEETHHFISNPAYLYTRNDNSKAYCTSAYQLYKTLIQPFEQEIKGKKLIIVPDGKLSYLPFEALLTEMPDTSGLIQFNNLPYLIRDNIINYTYSANVLFNFDKEYKKSNNRLLAFAPEYKSDTIRFNNEHLVLLPLPGVQREVELIAKEIKSTIYKGTEATEDNFRDASKGYDILHLAMHAFINDSMPAYSRFAFTQNNNSEAYNDGWLNTADIYNLDLNARLTVLSACNTGSGNLRKGEGVISLARGFLYAGCPSIVMSLWEVEDNAGTEIMHSFYRLLKKGRDIDEALRQAKLYYLEEANPRMAHPHYWLGYVSIGDSTPLFRSYDYYFFGLILIALIGLAVDQMVQLRKSGKKSYNRK